MNLSCKFNIFQCKLNIFKIGVWTFCLLKIPCLSNDFLFSSVPLSFLYFRLSKYPRDTSTLSNFSSATNFVYFRSKFIYFYCLICVQVHIICLILQLYCFTDFVYFICFEAFYVCIRNVNYNQWQTFLGHLKKPRIPFKTILIHYTHPISNAVLVQHPSWEGVLEYHLWYLCHTTLKGGTWGCIPCS